MKIKKLISKLQELEKEFWDNEVIMRIREWDMREEEEFDVDDVRKIDNSYDKRLKQKTTIIIT